MPLAEPYTEANDTITKDRTPQGNDGTVSGATIKYDGLVKWWCWCCLYKSRQGLWYLGI